MSRKKKIVYTVWTQEDTLRCLEVIFQNQKFQSILHKRANKHYDPTEFTSSFWELTLEELPRFNIEQDITPKELIKAIENPETKLDLEARNKLFKYLKILFLRIPSKLYEEKLPLEEAIDVPIINTKYYPQDFKIFLDHHLQEYLTPKQWQKWLNILSQETIKKNWKLKHMKKIIYKAYDKYKGE